MSEAIGFSAVCGQEIRLPGDNAAAGRKPRGFDAGHKLIKEVGPRMSEGERC